MVWHQTQTFTVKWGNTLSQPFNVSNGICQGGIMSPVLLNIYMDDLSTLLNNASISCKLNNVYINHLFHTDSVIFATSLLALELLLDYCDTFAKDNELE